MRALKMRNTVAAIGSWQWPTERIIKADPLTTGETAEELIVNHLTVVWHLKQTGKVKKLNKWMPQWSWQKFKKVVFWSVIFSYSMQQRTGLWHVTKSGFYTTITDNQLSGWTKKKLQGTSQSQTCTQKRWWSLFGGLLPVWFTTAFWIPAKPLPLRSMLSKLMRCTENCDAYSWHWSRERAQFSRTMPDGTSHNQRFKSWKNWATKFCLILHIHLTSCQLSLLKASWKPFTGNKLLQPEGGRKCSPRVCRILEHRFLCHRNKQTYFSLAEMYWV